MSTKEVCTTVDMHIFGRKQLTCSGLSRNAIFTAVNASLKRLDIDYLDLLQIHRFDSFTPIEETMEALHDLVKMGKVNYIGASSMWAYQFAMMQFWSAAQFECLKTGTDRLDQCREEWMDQVCEHAEPLQLAL